MYSASTLPGGIRPDKCVARHADGHVAADLADLGDLGRLGADAPGAAAALDTSGATRVDGVTHVAE
jgi:hypothetical protein